MRALGALYCTPLSDAERAEIDARVAAVRASELRGLIQRALTPGGVADLGDLGPRLTSALAELLALSSARPERFRRIVDHWSTTFLLRQLLTTAPGEVDRERVLAAIASARIALEDAAAVDGGADRLLPWDVALVDGPALGLCPGPRAPALDEPSLSLRRSMSAAYELIDAVWPEVTSWAAPIVPAFVDMGEPPRREVHTSVSIGPGHAVSITRVYDPFLHAEDVVHELQHGRLYLLGASDTFPSWTDETARFASPYRPDPRPLRGLLLGMHAFLAVNRLRLLAAARGLWQADLRAMFNSHRANLFVFRTLLEHERVTETGQGLLAEMACAITAQHQAIEAQVPSELGRSFDEAFAAHLAAVSRRSDIPLVNVSPLHCDWEETVRLAARVGAPAPEREAIHAP